ncbi:hypothetical protein HZS_1171 [Henneguya salminicola]|nr:hypothetical protein HZS_1171 [Henneguya salminicola]
MENHLINIRILLQKILTNVNYLPDPEIHAKILSRLEESNDPFYKGIYIIDHSDPSSTLMPIFDNLMKILEKYSKKYEIFDAETTDQIFSIQDNNEKLHKIFDSFDKIRDTLIDGSVNELLKKINKTEKWVNINFIL